MFVPGLLYGISVTRGTLIADLPDARAVEVPHEDGAARRMIVTSQITQDAQ
jgi:hypothetical protein